MTPNKFLEKFSGKIVAVGDTFDHMRSSVVDETMDAYIERTKIYWKHINDYVLGNHDSRFLEYNQAQFHSVEYYKNKSVLAFHGHQLWFAFNQKLVSKYEQRWFSQLSKASLFWDIEEWICKVFNKYFLLSIRQSNELALRNLRLIDKAGLLDSDIKTIITGHTHLPFDVKVEYNGKKYRVINLGSALKGKRFRPVYIAEIDRWFVSDLHLGTNKSILN